MTMKLTSSWMNEIVQLQKDQELGEFSLEIPVDSSQLDKMDSFVMYGKRTKLPNTKSEAKASLSLVLIWASAMKTMNTASASVPRIQAIHRIERDLWHNRTISQELEKRPETKKSNGTFGRHIDAQLAGSIQPTMEWADQAMGYYNTESTGRHHYPGCNR